GFSNVHYTRTATKLHGDGNADDRTATLSIFDDSNVAAATVNSTANVAEAAVVGTNQAINGGTEGVTHISNALVATFTDGSSNTRSEERRVGKGGSSTWPGTEGKSNDDYT